MPESKFGKILRTVWSKITFGWVFLVMNVILGFLILHVNISVGGAYERSQNFWVTIISLPSINHPRFFRTIESRQV